MRLKIYRQNIYLTGFMGTGKTSVGKIIAFRAKMPLVDTDRLIEETCKMPVAQIFNEHGEEYFRDMEADIFNKIALIKTEHLVVATGGGAVLRASNRKAMKNSGAVVLLTATPLAIYRRIAKNSDRPLLAGRGGLERVKTMLSERESFYDQCDIKVDTTSKTPSLVASEIINLLGLFPKEPG